MKFNCQKCPGYCCSHPRIAVTDNDLRRLAAHAGISEAAARKDVIYRSVCSLFDRETRKCTVYAARPYVCRRYPYGASCGYYDFLKFERAHQGDEKYIPTF